MSWCEEAAVFDCQGKGGHPAPSSSNDCRWFSICGGLRTRAAHGELWGSGPCCYYLTTAERSGLGLVS